MLQISHHYTLIGTFARVFFLWAINQLKLDIYTHKDGFYHDFIIEKKFYFHALNISRKAHAFSDHNFLIYSLLLSVYL